MTVFVDAGIPRGLYSVGVYGPFLTQRNRKLHGAIAEPLARVCVGGSAVLFYLTIVEFFRLVRLRMSDDGLLMVNVLDKGKSEA